MPPPSGQRAATVRTPSSAQWRQGDWGPAEEMGGEEDPALMCTNEVRT